MKKKLFITGCLFLTSFVGYNQLQQQNVQLKFDGYKRSINKQITNRSTSCIDTVDYTISKASGLEVLTINNSSSAQAAGQYFDCPQPISISGVDFFAFSTSLPSVNCTIKIYTAGSDSLPTGPFLASTTVAIDSNFGGGSLDTLLKNALFSSPILLTNPYVIVFENISPNSISLVSSDYDAGNDGAGEFLASVDLFGTWLNSYNVNIGGKVFDADWLFSPVVSYDINAGFSYDEYCIPNTVNFTNSSSPIFNNRMYNRLFSLGAEEFTYTWNFGDGNPDTNIVNATHTYLAQGPFTVILNDTILMWRSLCVTDTSIVIDGRKPVAGFKDSADGLTVYFTDTSIAYVDQVVSWVWDFGDGNSSTMQNPTHTYATSGTYNVCLITSGLCGNDTVCTLVNIVTTGIENNSPNEIIIYPNPAQDIITIKSNYSALNIIDVTGRPVKQLTTLNKGLNQVNITELVEGTYFVVTPEAKVLSTFVKN